MRQQFVDGDHACILWDGETAENVYELGTDMFVVRDGKIVAQSFTGRIRVLSLFMAEPMLGCTRDTQEIAGLAPQRGAGIHLSPL
jgi:hypothetical protein